MQEEEIYTPRNFLPALVRYRFHLLISISVLVVAVLISVVLLPSSYLASGRVMVETQQIPVDLVQSTVRAAASQQIDVIKHRVMTRENLQTLVQKYDYFQAMDAPPAELAKKVADLRDNIKVSVASTKQGRQTVAIGFIVSFKSRSPSVSRSVANDLINLFLSENVRARTERASETTEFLKSEAEKIRKELNTIEKQVADYKNDNKDSLPEHLDLYMGMREDARSRIYRIDRNIASNTDQISIMRTQLALVKKEKISISGSSKSEIASLRNKLREKLLIYLPSHPDVISIRQQITFLTNGIELDEDNPAAVSNAEIEINNRIASLQNEIQLMNSEKDRERAKLDDLEKRIIAIPQVERGFVAIERDYDAKQKQYQAIVAKAQSAEMAESLELEKKAERFTLLEPPVVPTNPFEPDRKKLFLLGFLISIALPCGFVMAMGFFDTTVRTANSLEKLIGHRPLIEIPYINERLDLKRIRESRMANIKRKLPLVGAVSTSSHIKLRLASMKVRKFFLRLINQ